MKVEWDILKFSFHSLATVALSIILSHQALVRPGLTQNRLGLRSCHLRRWRRSVADVKLPCDNNLLFLRNIAVHIKKFIAWTCNKIRQPETVSNVSTRSSILVLSQTQKIAGGKISAFEIKIVYTTKLSGFKSFRIQSSHFRFRIQNLRRHDKTGKVLCRIRPLLCKRQN